MATTSCLKQEIGTITTNRGLSGRVLAEGRRYVWLVERQEYASLHFKSQKTFLLVSLHDSRMARGSCRSAESLPLQLIVDLCLDWHIVFPATMTAQNIA